jgi:hypothetical protein
VLDYTIGQRDLEGTTVLNRMFSFGPRGQLDCLHSGMISGLCPKIMVARAGVAQS